MKKIVIIGILAISALAWDCSDFDLKESKMAPSTYCKNVVAYQSVMIYDRVSIKMGKRVTYDNDFAIQVAESLAEHANQCYDTCMMKNAGI